MYSASRWTGKKWVAVESLQKHWVCDARQMTKKTRVFQNQAMPIQFSIVPIEGKPYTAEARPSKVARDT